MAALNQELETTVEKKEQELAEKDDALRKLESETAEQIQTLTVERDKLAADFAAVKKQTDRAEAERVARLPKDASTPGHSDFDPAKETKFTYAMASITGDATKASGFVVEADGKRYLYAPAGALAGNTRLSIANANGDKFAQFGNLEVAENCPFVRLELLEATEVPALQLAASSIQVGSDTKLSCLALTASSGAVTGEITNAFGQSNDAIDVDPNLLTGKVGGAVLEATTGKLLGIIVNPSADRTELWDDAATTGEVQLKVSRLNRSVSWQPVPIATFLAEAKKVADFDRMTKIAQAFAVLSPTPDGLGVTATVAGSTTAKTILTEATDFSPAVEVITLDALLVAKKARLGAADLKKRVVSLFSSAMSQFARNAAGFDPAKFSPYHRKRAENSLRWRKDVDERLRNASDSINGADLTPVEDRSKGAKPAGRR